MGSGERFGKYELIYKIADGGMAEVFLAVVERIGGFKKRVALKKILPSFSRDESFVHSFVNEARICGQLHHPNLVQVYEFDRIDDYLYLAMEFIDGLDLERIINHRLLQRKLIPPSVAAETVLQMLDGLEFAHTATSMDDEPLNVVHRDLKPSNILIDRSGVIKIVDFGVAKASTNLYKTMNVGTAKGTVSYMSPEQASGRIDLGPPSDLFGVGSILYELLTLRRLFDGENLFMILDEVRTAPLEERMARLPEVPDGLVNVLKKALTRDIAGRYQSASAMARDLRAVFPDLQGTSLLVRFVEELINEGLEIAGTGEGTGAGAEATGAVIGGWTPQGQLETRPDLAAPDGVMLNASPPLVVNRPAKMRPGISSLIEPESSGVSRQGIPPGRSWQSNEPEEDPEDTIKRKARESAISDSSGRTEPQSPEGTDVTPATRAGDSARKPPRRPLTSSLFDEDDVTPVTRGKALLEKAGHSSSDQKQSWIQAPSTSSQTAPPPNGTRDIPAGQLARRDTRAQDGIPPEASSIPLSTESAPANESAPAKSEYTGTQSNNIHNHAAEDSARSASSFGDHSANRVSAPLYGAAHKDGQETGYQTLPISMDPQEATQRYRALGDEADGDALYGPPVAPDIVVQEPTQVYGNEAAEAPPDDYATSWQLRDGEQVPSPDWAMDSGEWPNTGWDASAQRFEKGPDEPLPEPVANYEVESLLSEPPSWVQGEPRPFGAPLERINKAPEVSRHVQKEAELDRLRGLRGLLTLLMFVCVAAAVWTYLDMKPSIIEALPIERRVYFVVAGIPEWGNPIFLGDPAPESVEGVEIAAQSGATNGRERLYRARIRGKTSYYLKMAGEQYKGQEEYTIVVDPDNPSTWTVRHGFTPRLRNR